MYAGEAPAIFKKTGSGRWVLGTGKSLKTEGRSQKKRRWIRNEEVTVLFFGTVTGVRQQLE
ncbi:MAG: hypothetical protein A2231_02745 [Candidatus Firestonebacteria bacterium RIFOXYA2_FULL_40_8]|nr:MAG: hypothetical protein A2231_02745 [Candidatus Firestonebacteria bacterium RIFOXYA2_FULL_40_8]